MTRLRKEEGASTIATLFCATSHISRYGAFPRYRCTKDALLSGLSVTMKLAKFNKGEGMYLKLTSEFVEFIADQDHEIEDVLGHLVLNIMAPLGASSAFISQLDNQNSLVIAGRFGITAATSSSYEDHFSLSDHLPITDAIRLRKVIVINSLPNWPREYATLSSTPYMSLEKSFIAFPIERSGTPVAVVAIFFNHEITLDADLELFFQSIANVLAMYLYRKPCVQYVYRSRLQSESISQAKRSEFGIELTQRQQLILRMISEGHTNTAIGDMLKYSESTIRQETIKIFSKLGCDGRDEASEIYKIQQNEAHAVG
jgi:DNA-binding CsgD family transcriptional regulator